MASEHYFIVYQEEKKMLTLDRVYKAKRVLSEVVRQTDMIRAKNINSQCDVYLKTENLQVTGSFKVRGSYFKISQLSDEEKKKGVIACSAIGSVWSHVEQQRQDAAKVEMSVEQSLSRTRSVHVSVEVKDGAMWDTARGDSQMLIHIVGRTLKGQTIDEYQYVNSAGDGIELKPGDYELTVDEPPVATDGTRFRASKRMVPVSFNSQAPDTVDSTPQGGFDLYAIAQ